MKKAQIFTLDAIIALVVVVTAIGLIVNAFELKEYNLREEEKFSELKNKAETAALMLAVNENLNCSVGSTGIKIQNCVYNYGDSIKSELGLSDEFKCNITNTDNPITLMGCEDSLPTDKEVVAITKNILYMNNASGELIKAEWNDCIRGASCPLSSKEFTISVWRA